MDATVISLTKILAKRAAEEEFSKLKTPADGLNGLDGKDGVDGKAGKGGLDGKDGRDGLDGKAGKDGRDGKAGKDGLDGKDGRDGLDGADGKDGKDGLDGADGKDGADGDDGVGVEKVSTNKNGNLVITLTDGKKTTIPLPKPRTVFGVGGGGGSSTSSQPALTGLSITSKIDEHIGDTSWRRASFVEEFNGTASFATVDHNLDGLTSTLFVHRSGYHIDVVSRETSPNTLQISTILPLDGFLILK